MCHRIRVTTGMWYGWIPQHIFARKGDGIGVMGLRIVARYDHEFEVMSQRIVVITGQGIEAIWRRCANNAFAARPRTAWFFRLGCPLSGVFANAALVASGQGRFLAAEMRRYHGLTQHIPRR